MTTIAIELPDEIAAQLKAEARRLNIAPGQLAALGVAEMLSKPQSEFEKIARRVIAQNEALLRRLA